MKKMSIVTLLIVTMMINMVPSFSVNAAEGDVLNMTFNDIATGEIAIDGLNIASGKASVAITSPGKDKGLYLEEHMYETTVMAKGIQTAGIDVVYSVDVMADNKPVNLSFGTAVTETSASSSDTRLFEIKNSSVYTHDGKKIGTVNRNRYTTISVISKKTKLLDYYINGKCVLSDWRFPDKSLGLNITIRQAPKTTCFIDNIRCYAGSDIKKNMPTAAFLDQKADVIGSVDFTGDVTFFDNRYCFISANPYYRRVTMAPKSNEIIATRLMDYKSPTRTNYMHMVRKRNADDCFFDIDLTILQLTHPGDFKHRYLKMEGDFKADKLQDIQFLVSDTKTTGAVISTEINITPDGAVKGGGKKKLGVVKQGEWFHLLWALNLDTQTYDVYIDGEKVLADIDMKADLKQFNTFRVKLDYSAVVGDLYIDNFDVTGLVKPIVDGIETKTRVIPDDDALVAFLCDKVGMHVYGNTLHKDGVKTSLETNGIYDAVTEQYYVTADTLNKAFDTELSDANGEITGDISINKDGVVTLKDGKQFTLKYTPKTENGRLYVPIKQLGSDAFGKYVWWFKTGILLFSDYEIHINTDDWSWQSERDSSSASGCTRWNDIDHLNGYLQYIRPDVERLKADYIAHTGDTDFTQHPRIYHTADEFKAMKEKYEANVDPLFTKFVNNYILKADKYLTEPFADYSIWLDTMRHMAGREISYRFMAWGLAYQLTGDQKYVDAAAKQFEIAASFPDFNTSHVIDTGESASGLAIGYDWFYNAFTPEQRETALVAIRDKCLDMLASGMYGRLTSASDGASEWRSFKLMNNYNAIVNAGITLASIATLEYNTDTTFQYIADSTRSMEYTMQMFPPGGAWTEGPNYLNFTLQSIVPWAINMENNFGRSYNIMDGQGMNGVADFMVACTGTEGTNNIGDSEKTSALSYESYFYFAERYNKPYASYMRWQDINSGNTDASFYDLVTWDFDAVKMDAASLETLSKTQRVNGMELFSIRDSYAASDAKFFFSTHFGTTSGYHQHWDCGTFVLDFMGKRWAYDLGMDNYNLQNELGYKGYEIFRKRGEAHNMLVIDPAKYNFGVETTEGQFAPIIDYQSNSYGGYVYANMDDVYEDSDKMTLGYYIDDNMTSVTMRNEFTLKQSKPCIWTMMTKGDIEIEGNIAYITQADGSIKLEFLCSDDNARWEDCGNPKPLPETVPADKFEKQKQNAEYTQLRLWFNGNPGENKVIVKITPTGAATKPIEDITFSEWKLPEKSTLAESVNTNFKVLYMGEPVPDLCPVYDENEMPVFEIVTEDPNAIVEVEYAEDINGKTRITVWDPNKIAFQKGTISYYKASGVSMGEFETIPIYKIEVSSTPEEANHKDNMLDNDLNTRWTAMARGEYAIFDLGDIVDIDGFATCFYKGTARRYFFDVYLSDDGENWRPAYMNGASSGTTEELELYAFDQREKARYVKLVGNGNTVNPPSDVNFNVLEFRAMIKKY